MDWVAAGIVTPVRDMLNCGASWIFSATGAIESLIKNVTNATVRLSEQQVLECTNGTCSSGFTFKTFNYTTFFGVFLEDIYTYLGYENTGTICHASAYNGVTPYKISNITATGSSCLSVAIALQTGPLPVYVVSNSNWMVYSSGIFNGCTGGTQNYYILLVGVSNTAWTLKNSLGTSWGDQGYIRLAPGNTCKICDSGSFLPVY